MSYISRSRSYGVLYQPNGGHGRSEGIVGIDLRS